MRRMRIWVVQRAPALTLSTTTRDRVAHVSRSHASVHDDKVSGPTCSDAYRGVHRPSRKSLALVAASPVNFSGFQPSRIHVDPSLYSTRFMTALCF